MADELGDHPVDRVRRDGEADAGVGAGGADDGRVDADQPAAAVEQRPSRVARVDRRVGLDGVADRLPGLGLDLAPEGADHARGEALVEAERVADGEDLLAHL